MQSMKYWELPTIGRLAVATGKSGPVYRPDTGEDVYYLPANPYFRTLSNPYSLIVSCVVAIAILVYPAKLHRYIRPSFFGRSK
jgi:hypothetical protein